MATGEKFPDPPPEPGAGAASAQPESLKTRAIRGTVLSFGGQAANQVLRLASNLILTRLLFPEAFGIMALVMVVITGVEMVSDLGVRVSIIQSERGGDRAFLDTAWTISVLRGGVLFLIGLAIAWPFAEFYDEPMLAAMVPATTLMLVVQGAASSKLALLHRHIQLGRIVAFGLASQLVGAVVTIIWAVIYRDAWALVVGTLANAATNFLLSHIAIPGPMDRFRWDPDAARTIVSFGKWIFASTMITFLANNLHTLLLGKLVTKDLLGVYNTAGTLSMLPMTIGGQVIGSVLLPALSESFRQDPKVLAANYDRARTIILPFAGFACLGVALAAPAFYTYLYDPRYHDAGWMAQLLALSVWFLFLHEASGRALQAMGDARSLALANGAKLIAIGGFSVLGFELGGLPGFIVGTAMGGMCGQVVLSIRLHRRQLASGMMELRYTVIGIVIGVVASAVPYVLSNVTGVGYVHLSLGVAILVLTPIGLWVARGLLREVRKK